MGRIAGFMGFEDSDGFRDSLFHHLRCVETRYTGFFGNDVLNRNGYRGYLADNGIGSDVTTGLVTGKLSYGELTAPGDQLFARPNPTNAKKIQLLLNADATRLLRPGGSSRKRLSGAPARPGAPGSRARRARPAACRAACRCSDWWTWVP